MRFAVNAPLDSRDKSLRSSDGAARVLRLTYVCERGHRPVEHGELEFDIAQTAWLKRHSDPRIQKMAECFLESYLKKKS